MHRLKRLLLVLYLLHGPGQSLDPGYARKNGLTFSMQSSRREKGRSICTAVTCIHDRYKGLIDPTLSLAHTLSGRVTGTQQVITVYESRRYST
jgi:hypothetical protein